MNETQISMMVDRKFKERSEQLFKKIEERYTEVIRERVTNDVHNQNFAVKQQHPETQLLSFILKNGEFAVPYTVGTKLTLSFVSGSETKEVQIDTTTGEKVDVAMLLKLCRENEYCVIRTYTGKEVQLFDEEALEKSETIIKCDYNWSQVFEGLYRCEDVLGVYQTVSKLEKVDKSSC